MGETEELMRVPWWGASKKKQDDPLQFFFKFLNGELDVLILESLHIFHTCKSHQWHWQGRGRPQETMVQFIWIRIYHFNIFLNPFRALKKNPTKSVVDKQQKLSSCESWDVQGDGIGLLGIHWRSTSGHAETGTGAGMDGVLLLVCSSTFVSTAIVDFITSSVSLHDGKCKGTQRAFF